MDRLQFRPASAADLPRMNEIMNDPPAPGMLAIAGSNAMSMRAGSHLLAVGIALNLETTTLAEREGRTVGLMDASSNHQDPKVTPLVIARLLPRLLLSGGAGSVYRLLRSRPAWARVAFKTDLSSYYIAELDVSADARNQGIGAAFLQLAEERARTEGCPRLTLTTDISNAAQHLYQRAGFVIAETRRDAAYERYSGGSPGRVRMVKELA